MSAPIASLNYAEGDLQEALEFLKRTRAELRPLHRIHVYKDKIHIIDVNKDYFEIRGVGYPDAEVVPLLQAVNTAFNPATIHDVIQADYKEFGAGRRYTWAHDRVM